MLEMCKLLRLRRSRSNSLPALVSITMALSLDTMVEELALVEIMICLLKLMVSVLSASFSTPELSPMAAGHLYLVELIADSYITTGKHGHGVLPHDRFEKAYYEKHPELIKKEIDQYHERPAWAMSSDDLNKIVRDTASRASGLGKTAFVLHKHCWSSLRSFLC